MILEKYLHGHYVVFIVPYHSWAQNVHTPVSFCLLVISFYFMVDLWSYHTECFRFYHLVLWLSIFDLARTSNSERHFMCHNMIKHCLVFRRVWKWSKILLKRYRLLSKSLSKSGFLLLSVCLPPGMFTSFNLQRENTLSYCSKSKGFWAIWCLEALGLLKEKGRNLCLSEPRDHRMTIRRVRLEELEEVLRLDEPRGYGEMVHKQPTD